MALIETSLSAGTVSTINAAATTPPHGVWLESQQAIITSIDGSNNSDTFVRLLPDATEILVGVTGIDGGRGMVAYCLNEAGALIGLQGTSAGGQRLKLFSVDPITGSATQVGQDGPTGSEEWTPIALFQGTGRLFAIPLGDPYGIGSNRIVEVDIDTVTWPLIRSVPAGSSIGETAAWAAKKDANNFYVGDASVGSTLFHEMRFSDLTGVATFNLPRNLSLVTYDPIRERFLGVVESGETEGDKVSTVANLDDITSMDVDFVKPRFGLGTLITVVPRNSQGIAQKNRVVQAELQPNSPNSTVLGSLESLVETTGFDGAATFRYIAPASNPSEPNDADDIEFTVET